MIKTTDFDAIAASVPADKTAGNVVARNGVHYEPSKKAIPQKDFRASIDPIKTWRSPKPWALALQVRQLTGKKYGRWTVIGYAEWQPPGRERANWVVKCSCGRYETRKLKAIRRAEETQDCCWECKTLAHNQRRYRELGSKTFSDFVEPKDQ